MRLSKIKVIHHSDTSCFKPIKEFLDDKYIAHYDKPERVNSILASIVASPDLDIVDAKGSGVDPSMVHSSSLINRFSQSVSLTEEILSNVKNRDPLCLDSYTPLNNKLSNSLNASLSITNEALVQYLEGNNTYALTRPPGHHSSESTYGGYCYYNYAGLAAQALSKHGTVAILDIDFHHGNGTQDIFYKRNDVMTVSIHADPKKHFPHTGYESEKGEYLGSGFNMNIVLEDNTGITVYQTALLKALKAIKKFDPDYLVIPYGADTYIDDPLGSFQLNTVDYRTIAKLISREFDSVLIFQEGGYHVEDLGKNVVSFLSGF
jgi:acetoin utilization deacetylase AcuC-like enzyme